MSPREETDMIVSVTAHAPNPDLPTVGPWTIDCSTCGVLGVAVTTLATDRAIADHIVTHALALA